MNHALAKRPLITAAISFIFATAALVAPSHGAEPAAAPVPTELRGDHMEMTSSETETFAIFTGSVTLTGTNLRINCDRLEITAMRIGDKSATESTLEKIKYILAIGHVRIVQGEREATCERAEVFPREDKIILTGEPVAINHSNGFVGAGEKITIFRGKEEIIVDKPKYSLPPIRDLGANAKPKSSPASTPATAPAPTSSGVTFPSPTR